MAVIESPKVGVTKRRGSKDAVDGSAAPAVDFLVIKAFAVGAFDGEPKIVATSEPIVIDDVGAGPKIGNLSGDPLILQSKIYARKEKMIDFGNGVEVHHDQTIPFPLEK